MVSLISLADCGIPHYECIAANCTGLWRWVHNCADYSKKTNVVRHWWYFTLLLGSNVGFARALDLKILGEKHLYQGYGIPFDPEGLFHSIPAVGTALLGYQAGRLVKSSPEPKTLVRVLL